MSQEEVLEEVDLYVKPFEFKPDQLASLVNPKRLKNLSLGAVEGLLRSRGLGTYLCPVHRVADPSCKVTHVISGQCFDRYGMQITPKSLVDGQCVYGQNILPQRPSKSLLRSIWLALQEQHLILLSFAAVVSLALGLFQDFCTSRPEGKPPVDWVGGVVIIAAILIVLAVGSLNDWQKEKQFKTLNAKKEDRLVKVIRGGEERQIRLHQVAVGDVMSLEPGEIIPFDGVLLSGHYVRCDESSATGESDSIKVSYEECIALSDKRPTELDPGGPFGYDELLGHADCYIVGGSKVLEGVGSYVVVAVGTKSSNGRITKALSQDSENENTLLLLKLGNLADVITKISIISGGLLFVLLLVRYFFEPGTTNPQRLGVAFVNILMISVALMVMAIPEGLPLSVTLALAFATKQMSKENIFVRALRSCEAIANASTLICTDKIGSLTQNKMTLVSGTVGIHTQFVQRLEEHQRERTGAPDSKDSSVDLANLNGFLPLPLKNLFNAAIAITSTEFEGVDPGSGTPVFIGSKIELALLGFAKELGWPNYKDIRCSVDIVQTIPFSSERKSMGCVIQLPDGHHRLYVKGASEILASNCTRHVILGDSGANEIETAPIGALEQHLISCIITSYASQALRTIALCYRDFPSWPPNGAQILGRDEVDYYDLTTDLTLISIIGVEGPLRPGVREAVAKCSQAGVRVKMCSGDNVLTAKSIAHQCGIYTAGGIVMEGSLFRTLSPDVMKAIVPRIQVLARSSPEDKRIFVETLKEQGDVVGVIGGGANDGPALKSAHVGFSLGISGTEVAKEASDIILMDDSFSSIVKAIMCGRCIRDSVCKFLQFQISAKITAVVTTFVWALASLSEESPLSVVQLLWVNLIMDALAALALATDRASSVQLERKPDKKTDPLFSINMIKQILGQAIYQITVILVFHFLGSHILGFHHTDDATLQKGHRDTVRTLILNAFVFAQIFNSFNCRRLDRKLNVFEGMTKNWYFMVITAIEVAVQILICFFGGSAFDVRRMGPREWVISLALGGASLPIGAFIRLIPNEPCERAFNKLQLLPTPELQRVP